jgi:hypothetical protein
MPTDLPVRKEASAHRLGVQVSYSKAIMILAALLWAAVVAQLVSDATWPAPAEFAAEPVLGPILP